MVGFSQAEKSLFALLILLHDHSLQPEDVIKIKSYCKLSSSEVCPFWNRDKYTNCPEIFVQILISVAGAV